MSDFLIRFSSAEDALDQIHQVEMEIRSEEDETSRIRNGFRSEFGGRERILRNLKKLIDRFNDLGEGAFSFQENLEMILRLYRDAEEGILGNFSNSSSKLNPSSSERTDAVSSEDDHEGSSIIDRIDAFGKKDEVNGLLPGVGMVTAGVLGAGTQSSLTGADQTVGSMAGGDIMSEGGADVDADEPRPMEARSADLEELTPAVSFPSEGAISGEEDLPVFSVEEFLASLPEDIRKALSDDCLKYLREIFDAINRFGMVFGDVHFPRLETMIASGIWASFFTFLMWYFYRNNEKEEGAETGGTEDKGTEEGVNEEDGTDENSDAIEESVDEESVSDEAVGSSDVGEGDEQPESPTGEDESAENVDSDSASAETETGNNSGINDPEAEAAAKVQTAADNTMTEDNSGSSNGRSGTGKSSSGGSGGGSGSGAGTGGYSGLADSADLYPGIDNGTVAAEAGPDTVLSEANTLSEGSEPKADYLSSLLGDKGSVTSGLKNWMEAGMDNWGREAAQKLHTSASSFSVSNPVKTVAKSVVNAAVVDAGIQLASHGAGIVGSAIGGGKADLFEELEEEFAV